MRPGKWLDLPLVLSLRGRPLGRTPAGVVCYPTIPGLISGAIYGLAWIGGTGLFAKHVFERG